MDASLQKPRHSSLSQMMFQIRALEAPNNTGFFCGLMCLDNHMCRYSSGTRAERQLQFLSLTPQTIRSK